MPRAIIKNPVGNVGDVREDVKVVLYHDQEPNAVQKYIMSLSKKNVNYSAEFYFANWETVISNIEWGEYTEELSDLLEAIPEITALYQNLTCFYNWKNIQNYDLFFQLNDLEEILEDYLNWFIKAGEIDILWYWKTIFYKDGELRYIIGDKQSGNDITVYLDADMWIRFEVKWAKVQNTNSDWFEIFNQNLVYYIFAEATKDGAVCYLPMTIYEKLLEFLWTKLIQFENPSQFIEKEYDKKRWTDAGYVIGEDDSQTFFAHYNWIKYSWVVVYDEETGEWHVETTYEEWGNDLYATRMSETLNAYLYPQNVRVWLNDTYAILTTWETNHVEGIDKEKQMNDLILYALNNSTQSLSNLESYSFSIIWWAEPWIFRTYTLADGIFYQRMADRFWYKDENYSIFNQALFNLLSSYPMLLPLDIFEKLSSINYRNVPATWVSISYDWQNPLTIGETATIHRKVLPTTTGNYSWDSLATNPNWFRLSSDPTKVSVVDYFGEWEVSALEYWSSYISYVSQDWWFSQSVQVRTQSVPVSFYPTNKITYSEEEVDGEMAMTCEVFNEDWENYIIIHADPDWEWGYDVYAEGVWACADEDHCDQIINNEIIINAIMSSCTDVYASWNTPTDMVFTQEARELIDSFFMEEVSQESIDALEQWIDWLYNWWDSQEVVEQAEIVITFELPQDAPSWASFVDPNTWDTYMSYLLNTIPIWDSVLLNWIDFSTWEIHITRWPDYEYVDELILETHPNLWDQEQYAITWYIMNWTDLQEGEDYDLSFGDYWRNITITPVFDTNPEYQE